MDRNELDALSSIAKRRRTVKPGGGRVVAPGRRSMSLCARGAPRGQSPTNLRSVPGGGFADALGNATGPAKIGTVPGGRLAGLITTRSWGLLFWRDALDYK